MAEGFRDIGRAVECGVCYNHYDTSARKPKVLTNCGHSLCRECVVGILSSNRVECPTCRSFTPLKTIDPDSLPTNYTVLSMIASLCSECVNDKWVSKCDLCKINLCTGCQESHASDEVKDVRKALDSLEKVIRGANECKVKVESAVRECERIITERKWRSFSCKSMSLSEALKKIAEVERKLKFEVTQSFGEGCIDKTLETQLEYRDSAFQYRSQRQENGASLFADAFHVLAVRYLAFSSKYVSGSTDVPAANCIAFSKQSGNYLITSTAHNEVNIVDHDLKVIRTFAIDKMIKDEKEQPFLGRFFGIATFNGFVFISDIVLNVIHIVKEDGSYYRKIGKSGTGATEFRAPRGLACDRDGRVYVCDSGNERIRVLTRGGTFLLDFPCLVIEKSRSYKYEPQHIAVTKESNVLVSDAEGNVHLFGGKGGHIWTLRANRNPHHVKATGVAVDNFNKIVISDTTGRILLMEQESNSLICEIGIGQLRHPRGIVVSPNHDIIVCDWGNNRVQGFRYKGVGKVIGIIVAYVTVFGCYCFVLVSLHLK